MELSFGEDNVTNLFDVHASIPFLVWVYKSISLCTEYITTWENITTNDADITLPTKQHRL